LTKTGDIAAKPLVPPMLYVPVTDYRSGTDEVTIDFRRMTDGRTALLAFTALDRLIDGCGATQPWVLLPTGALAEIDQHSPYDVILLDVTIPADERRTAGDQ
jgi:hypothetical protein